ncbi:hypothetical protein [Albibacterium sp.]|uniref:hypothetical protein n=1 Tax=Albibacterium sp. TaxID=2952885 RepID=UPI002D05369E|nr:hypothetical protein [Albibacterium sp.]HUH19389.1 hypothetical protein [Albibacterium sp.]
MIPEGIQAIFDFVDYLDSRKQVLIEKFIPLCEELEELRVSKNKLKPESNYREKRQYDILQTEIELKFEPLMTDVYQPITGKLKELGIWSGDHVFTSIENNISASTSAFKNCFHDIDIDKVNQYKKKYLSFRNDTNSNFLTLQFVFSGLDEALKELFDFFNDTDDFELEALEHKVIECSSIEDALILYNKNPTENIRFAFPSIDNLNVSKNREVNKVTSSNLSELSMLIESFRKKMSVPIVEVTRTSFDEALHRVNSLKQIIENEDAYKLFNYPDNQNEAFLQYLFKIIRNESEWDINSEVNNGRGPVDFTVSKGAADKTVVEFKLAKNTDLKSNLQYQVDIYKKANNTDKAVTVILYFTDAEVKKTKRILEELGLNGKENIVLIDGRKKISASKERIQGNLA